MRRSFVYLIAVVFACTAVGQTKAKRSASKAPPPVAVAIDPDSVPAEGDEPKNLCDTQAAHPADKNRPVGVPGIADEKIASAAAIKACLLATADTPDNPRYMFQLGRAYWAGKQYEPALATFLKAQEKEYAPAYFYLGQAYQQGLVKGEKPDEEFAIDLYQAAAAEGFLPAKDMLAPADDEAGAGALKIDTANGYTKPELMQAFYSGKLEPLAAKRSEAMFYVGGMNKMLTEYSDALAQGSDDAAPDESCTALSDKATSGAIDYENLGISPNPSFMEVLRWATDQNLAAKLTSDAFKVPFQAGVDDMFLFLADTGGCSAAPAGEVMNNLKKFVKAKN